MISVHELTRHFRSNGRTIVAVDGLSFRVNPGEVYGLLGPNGAGKTTTLECLIGLREPDSGTIEVCGIDARRHPQEVKQRIGAARDQRAGCLTHRRSVFDIRFQ